MTSKQFHIGDILSITTGILVSPRLMDGVYDILNHMTGESLFTHQLPRAATACRPALLKQHPELADIAKPCLKPGDVPAWVAMQVERFGENLTVSPLPDGEYVSMDPLSELSAMMTPPEELS